MLKLNQKGQSLVEVVIALAIAVTIVIAFTNATISSIRNANYAKNQNQATKYVQQALEVIRAIRDQDGTIDGTNAFSTLFNTAQNTAVGSTGYTGNCYKLVKDSSTKLYLFQMTKSTSCTETAADDEQLDTQFYRKINISDDGADTPLTTPPTYSRKKIRVKVYWTDSKGTHSSDITTYLTKWK
jgi:Tfp pilus assembly protein PilV